MDVKHGAICFLITGLLLGAFVEDQHGTSLEFGMLFDIVLDCRDQRRS